MCNVFMVVFLVLLGSISVRKEKIPKQNLGSQEDDVVQKCRIVQDEAQGTCGELGPQGLSH